VNHFRMMNLEMYIQYFMNEILDNSADEI